MLWNFTNVVVGGNHPIMVYTLRQRYDQNQPKLLFISRSAQWSLSNLLYLTSKTTPIVNPPKRITSIPERERGSHPLPPRSIVGFSPMVLHGLASLLIDVCGAYNALLACQASCIAAVENERVESVRYRFDFGLLICWITLVPTAGNLFCQVFDHRCFIYTNFFSWRGR